jgi:transcriptional repressor NrdR
MKCPYCHAPDSRVTDSREVSGGSAIRRRRECAACGRRFTTFERVELAGLVVVKKDGRRQDFDPGKLRQKLRVALTKRPVGEDEIDKLVQRVEADLLALGQSEVPSSAIGESVLQQLKTVDHVAYIRFASVYREFADLQDLKREVDVLSDPETP